MLVVMECRRLSGGAARHHRVRAALHVELDQLPDLGLIDLPVAKRRDHRDERALKRPAHGTASLATGTPYVSRRRPIIYLRVVSNVFPRDRSIRMWGSQGTVTVASFDRSLSFTRRLAS